MRKHTILFLAANPSETHHLALDREAWEIQVELERSRGRARFELVTRWAAEPLDLLRLAPTMVQFSEHGGHLAATAAHVGPRSGRDVVSGARCVTLIRIERSAQSTTTRRSLPHPSSRAQNPRSAVHRSSSATSVLLPTPIPKDETPVDLVLFTRDLGDWWHPTDYPRSLAFLTQTCGALVVPLSPTGQP